MLKDEKCPNCGASLGGSSKCEYCGTVFDVLIQNDYDVEILYSDRETFAKRVGSDLFTINEKRRMRLM